MDPNMLAIVKIFAVTIDMVSLLANIPLFMMPQETLIVLRKTYLLP